MPTITTVDATWDTGVTMDASELRRADTAMFLGDGSNNGVRGGICRHGSTSLGVTVNGSDQVTVQAGAAIIPAATGLGVYRTSLGAATSAVALTARNATNPRIDLVVIQVTGTNATVKTIDGTPAASPSAPALPAQHIELARLTVPQVAGGAVTVDSSFRTFATALGGRILVPTLARLPGSGNILGQDALALDTGVEHVWDGSAWQVSPTSAPALVNGADFNISTATSGAPSATSITLSPGHWVIWGKGYSDNGAATTDHNATLFNATASTELDKAIVTVPAGTRAAWSLMAAITLTAASTIQLRMWPTATGATQLMNRVKLAAQRSGV